MIAGKRKILVIGSASGGAHLAAAKAVAEELGRRKIEVQFLDTHDFLPSPLRWFLIRGQWNLLNTVPEIAGWLVRKAKQASFLLPLRESLPFQFARFRRTVEDFSPRLVFATHPLGIFMLQRVGFSQLPKTMLLINYEAHLFQVHPAVQRYFVAHGLVKRDLLDLGVGEEQITVSGMPLGGDFDNPPQKAQARESLGIPRDAFVVLVSQGLWGNGWWTVGLVRRLQKALPEAFIWVIAGGNRIIGRVVALAVGGERSGRVRVTGAVPNFAEALAAADVLIGKAGGMSSTSAFVAGVPLVIFAPQRAMETVSAQRFVRAGVALDARGSSARCARLVKQLAEDESARSALAARARQFVVSGGRQRIARILISLL
jgi:processive 1,2-diacylglycerol beta-glucosyltransferase